VPDQTIFLERWYEFHSGYRIVRDSEGTEQRVAVNGEDFKDVSPGCLPRTLADLHDGRAAEAVQATAGGSFTDIPEETGPSLDEALDSMFVEAESEEQRQNVQVSTTALRSTSRQWASPQPPVDLQPQAADLTASRNREYQIRRVNGLRRELTRMRLGIERVITGLRELGQNVPDVEESTSVINRLDAIIEAPTDVIVDSINNSSNPTEPALPVSSSRPATTSQDDVQVRIAEVRDFLLLARRARDNASSQLAEHLARISTLEEQLSGLQREQRTRENYTRIFGTREEMLAQGENYESPIGGMFNRAMDRFRAAENVRQEQRTLRQVLLDEESQGYREIGSDRTEVERRLSELEVQDRDVWGVPLTMGPALQPGEPPVPRFGQGTDNFAFVFGSEPPAGRADMIAADRIGTPEILVPTDDELLLQQRYAMLRLQGAQAHEDVGSVAHVSDVEDTAADRAQSPDNSPDADNGSTPSLSEEQWWNEDAQIILRRLTEDSVLREHVVISFQDAHSQYTYFIEDYVTESHRMFLDFHMRDPFVIWRCRLPTEWVRRRIEMAQEGSIEPIGYFSGEGGNGGSAAWARHHNPYMRTEFAVHAYMMSSSIRRHVHSLTPPERLQLLYRFQADQRDIADLELLAEIRDLVDVESVVRAAYFEEGAPNGEDLEVEAINVARRDHFERAIASSRQELDERRRAAAATESSNRALAIAAGRQAMHTGSQALIDQMAQANATSVPTEPREPDQEAGTRAALHRLRASGFMRNRSLREGLRALDEDPTTTWTGGVPERLLPDDSESSRSTTPSPSRGLDAHDTGRPDPKTEEELLVSMGCKICYTQLAETACLPCGHLTMCRWCSDQYAPRLGHDHTRPRRPTPCPLCRKGIRQIVRIRT